MNINHIINALGEERSEYFDSVVPPIVQTSNFEFKTVEDFRACLFNKFDGEAFLYSRGKNPTLEILQKKCAAMDGAEKSLVCNSGASAIFAALVSNVTSGDHIISVKNPYGWAYKILNYFLPRFGVETTFVDGKDVENFYKAIKKNTKLIYLESPLSWTFELQDIPAITKWAKENKLITICDNSYCTPLYQNTIAMGVDISIQSATKYINGHCDTLGGVVSGKKEMIKKIFDLDFQATGIAASPMNAWLMLRGMRTLEVRLERISRTSHQVIKFLKQHPKVEKILFPFDTDFPQYELAQKQMKDAFGLFSIVLKTKKIDEIEKFCERLQHFSLAVSWGGYESLIMPKCVEILNKETFSSRIEEHQLIRIYIGLESAETLIHDLTLSLDKISD